MFSRLFNLLLLVALIITVCFLAKMVKGESISLPVVGGESAVISESPRIEVSASEFKKFAADKFITEFRLEMSGKNKDELFKRMAERRNIIFSNVRSLDIPEKNVEQNSVDIRKEWFYDKGHRELAGYVATQSFDVSCDRKSDAAALIASLSSEPDVEISRTSAMLKDEESVQASVIDAAGKKALDKAKKYAESVGAKAGKVLLVSGDGDGVVYGHTVLGRRHAKAMMVNSVMMDGGALDETTIADSVEVNASIRLVVELK